MTADPPKIRMVGDPVLHAVCRPVTEFDAALADLVDDMFAAMAIARGSGSPRRRSASDLAVFVYDCPDADGIQHAAM